MATPLSASWRIEFALTIAGQLRKIRTYVASTGARIGGITQIIYRDASSHDWVDASLQFLALMDTGISPTQLASPPTVTLQNLVGLIWTPIEVDTPTVTPTVASYQPASQLTYVLRDVLFHKVRVQYPEMAVPLPFHSNGPAPSGGLKQVGSGFDGTNTSIGVPADDPAHWMVSRANAYLALTGTIVGVTTDLNNKYRRARGLS